MNSRQLADRIGNANDRLVHQAGDSPNYGQQHRLNHLRRLLTATAAAALMITSFTAGALAFNTEKIVEVPTIQEAVVLDDLSVTLILPDSWKGKYEVIPWEGQYAVVCPEIRQDILAQTKQEFLDEGLPWDGELDRNPFAGGMLFYIAGIPEVLTPTQVEASSWSYTESRYLFATADRTYLLFYASDEQCTSDTLEQYNALLSSISEIQITLNHVIT